MQILSIVSSADGQLVMPNTLVLEGVVQFTADEVLAIGQQNNSETTDPAIEVRKRMAKQLRLESYIPLSHEIVCINTSVEPETQLQNWSFQVLCTRRFM